jgi:hypothetical protein
LEEGRRGEREVEDTKKAVSAGKSFTKRHRNHGEERIL